MGGNASNQSKLRVFCHDLSDGDMHSRADFGQTTWTSPHLYTFQLNEGHPCFATTIESREYEAKCKQNMIQFQSNAIAFCSNIVYMNIGLSEDKDMTISCFKKYYDEKLSHSERKIFGYEWKKVLSVLKKNTVRIRMNRLSHPLILRKKIMNLLGNIVSAKHIEICTQNRLILDALKSYNHCFYSGYCRFVLYDIMALPSTYTHLYKVRIFDPSKYPNPCYNEEGGIVIDIRYKKEFNVKEFVNYIFEVIKGSDNAIFSHRYQYLLPFYLDAVQSDDAMPFILTTETQTPRFDRQNNQTKSKFNANDQKVKSDDASKTVKLSFEFSVNDGSYSEDIGLPLIDQRIRGSLYHQHLVECLTTIQQPKKIKIEEYEYDDYKPFYECISNDTDNKFSIELHTIPKGMYRYISGNQIKHVL